MFSGVNHVVVGAPFSKKLEHLLRPKRSQVEEDGLRPEFSVQYRGHERQKGPCKTPVIFLVQLWWCCQLKTRW